MNEEIPEAFAYKILKSLEKAQIVRVTRGTHGGCMLIKNPEELYLYDIILAIGTGFCDHTLHEENLQSKSAGTAVLCACGTASRVQKLLPG